MVTLGVSLIKLDLPTTTMDNRGQHGMHDSKEFTEVINRNIKVGHEKDYYEWLRRYMKLESEVPGYLGTTIIAPGGNSSSVRYIINRFSDKSSLDAWEKSEVARKLIEEANTCSTYERKTGLETWFTLPNLKTITAPPRWKMAIVTFIGAYCVSSLAQYFIKLSIGQSPLLANVVMNMI